MNIVREATSSKRKCPICGESISSAQYDTHCKFELENIQQSNASRNGLLYKASNATLNDILLETRKAEDVLLKTRNELKRVSKKRQMVCRNQHDNKSRGVAVATGEEEESEFYLSALDGSQNCCICGEVIYGDQTEINEHMDLCLSRATAEPASKRTRTSGEEEYTWAGQTRVRATSLLSGSFERNGFVVGQIDSEEENEDVDIEANDESHFGRAQYSECDLALSSSAADESLKDDASTKGSSLQTKDIKGVEGGSYVIESLKDHIKQLESSNNITCRICLDDFDTPTISIICWHVHCEKCWLQSLAMKKLCPRCLVITNPSALRKIYL